MRRPDRLVRAFTLIELLVVIFIVGLLVALLLVGVMRVRESARRLQCSQNLRQIGLALQSYTSSFGVLPPGYQAGSGASFLVAILPYSDQKPIHDLFSSGGFATVAQLSLSLYNCPSDGAATRRQTGATNYAGNQGTGVQKYGYNGAFASEETIAPSNFTDGMSSTACVCEWLVGPLHGMIRDPVRSVFHTPVALIEPDQLELFASTCRNLDPLTAMLAPPTVGTVWTHGDFGHTLYNHVLSVGENSCLNGSKVQLGAWTAKSNHASGVNMLFADGNVRFMAATVNNAVWTAIGTRNGGEVGTDGL